MADFRGSKAELRPGQGQGPGPAEGGPSQHGGSKVAMPEGVQLMGGEPVLEEQEDGGQALLVPEGAFLKLTLPASPWALAEDGRLHEYTVVLALRLGELPSTPLPLFNGGAPPPQGDKVC